MITGIDILLWALFLGSIGLGVYAWIEDARRGYRYESRWMDETYRKK